MVSGQLLPHGNVGNLQDDMRDMASREFGPDLTSNFTYYLITEPA